MSRAFSIYFEIFCIILWWPFVDGHFVASYHTCRSAITSAVVRAVAKHYRRHAFTPCVTGRPRSACTTTHRHGLASGVSPTVRYQSRTPLAVTTIVIIRLASPSARCSQDQHSCNTAAVAGGKSVMKAVATAVAKAGRVSAHSRSSSVQRASAALGLLLCFLSCAGFR